MKDVIMMLEQIFTVHMALLMETNACRLGRWRSRVRLSDSTYLHHLHDTKKYLHFNYGPLSPKRRH